MSSGGIFLAVFLTKELFLFGAIVLQFHGLKHRWFWASFDSANLRFGVGIKAGNDSLHYAHQIHQWRWAFPKLALREVSGARRRVFLQRSRFPLARRL